jgi:hypothetical protein
MYAQFRTKFSCKLYCIVDFLTRYSKHTKDSIIWILKDSCLCGIIIDECFNKIIIRTSFSFDDYFVHNPMQFKTDDAMFLDKLGKIKRNKTVQFNFEDSNLFLQQEDANKTTKSRIPLTISNDILADFSTEFNCVVQFPMKTLDFTSICNDLKTSSFIKISVDKKMLTFEGLDTALAVNEFVQFEIPTDNQSTFNLSLPTNVLLPWRKSIVIIGDYLKLNMTPELLHISIVNKIDGNFTLDFFHRI